MENIKEHIIYFICCHACMFRSHIHFMKNISEHQFNYIGHEYYIQWQIFPVHKLVITHVQQKE